MPGYGQLGMRELGGGINFVQVGNGAGTSQLRVAKSETGTGQIEFYSAGVRRLQVELATNENGAIRTYDSSGALVSTTTVVNGTGEWIFPGEIEIDGAFDHDGTTVGFYGTTPGTRQTVSGSRGSNAALASLLTALATIGLVTDSSSA